MTCSAGALEAGNAHTHDAPASVLSPQLAAFLVHRRHVVLETRDGGSHDVPAGHDANEDAVAVDDTNAVSALLHDEIRGHLDARIRRHGEGFVHHLQCCWHPSETKHV